MQNFRKLPAMKRKIAGGNAVFPFLMALLLWYVPSRIRDFKDILKPRKD